MSVNKKLFELASKDDKVKAELNEATFKALFDLLKEKGFAEDAAEAVDTAMTKVAEAHGIKSEAMEELSEDELKAVAGGKGCIC
ncbi:MAG: bacteriocin, partial [Synergistaceae bacterium]|nr:bacteriocin [Synergistaceae bacterium]